ncbi:MAG: M48 family metallopeptidase [Gammaproteobacteria bacterium]|nr:M48 family metallopeptidase [Gammaproteobacteria bacterium]
MPFAPLRQPDLWDRDEDALGDWVVRASRRARRLSVRVWRAGAVEIVVPPGARPVDVARFVAQQRSWIERQRARCRPLVCEPFPPARIVLAATSEEWDCALLPGARAPLRVHGTRLVLAAGLDSERLRLALRRWLMARAQADFAAPLAALAVAMGVGYRRLQVRRQRTRWGSCSTRGTISLNCCLLFQRPAVVRYLMVHELAHLTHMNHSARFWRQVAHFEPHWRELDRELAQGWRQVPHWAVA